VIWDQLKRLTKHSLIYGVGSLIPRFLGLLLLPVYTRYLSPHEYGVVETLLAGSTLAVIVLRGGISSGFFRFYFDARDAGYRARVIRTTFWATLLSATAGLIVVLVLAEPISNALFGSREWTDAVRAAAVGLWGQINYEQTTAVFRVEERSTAFSIVTLVNALITAATAISLVVVFGLGATGVILGSAAGSLALFAGLILIERRPLAPEIDWRLLKGMNRFGLPLLPAGLLLWATYFSDRLLLATLSDIDEVGRYSIAVRLSSAVLLLFTGFRTAWTAFAYSIEDDREAKQVFSFVLTYVGLLAGWLALTLALLSPWLVRLLTQPEYYESSAVVAPLAFSGLAWVLYTVVSIGVGRAKRTGRVWLITLAGAAIDIGLNLVLIPPFGMEGAAAAALSAYVAMFLLMAWYGQHVYPTPYQWRRLTVVSGAAAGLTIAGKILDPPLVGVLLLCAAYPFLLRPLGFYIPEERLRIRRLARALRRPRSRAS